MIPTMTACVFMDQNLVVNVFLQILMWALSKTPLKIGKETAKFRMLQIGEGKHVHYIYTLVTLT